MAAVLGQRVKRPKRFIRQPADISGMFDRRRAGPGAEVGKNRGFTSARPGAGGLILRLPSGQAGAPALKPERSIRAQWPVPQATVAQD
jgi:hypothetical protein